MTRILIIEDDEDIAFIEKDYLEVSGYQVTVEINGIKGLTEALTGEYDLILLDVMLPGMDGFQICRKLRNKLDIPIMMVTAKRTEIDQIRGLGFGADDYIEKPFSPGVLVAKVKSQLSQYERLKGKRKAGQRVTLGDISLESDTHRVFVRGEEKMLPNKEFKLLVSCSIRMWCTAGKLSIRASGGWIHSAIRLRSLSTSIASAKRWKKIRRIRSTS